MKPPDYLYLTIKEFNNSMVEMEATIVHANKVMASYLDKLEAGTEKITQKLQGAASAELASIIDGTRQLPGMKEKVTHPVSKVRMTLWDAIVTLNDKYKWTREQIADWLDTLDMDLRFDVNRETP